MYTYIYTYICLCVHECDIPPLKIASSNLQVKTKKVDLVSMLNRAHSLRALFLALRK